MQSLPAGNGAAAEPDADSEVVLAVTEAAPHRLVAMRADGTIGDAAFQRVETELDWADLDCAQILRSDDSSGPEKFEVSPCLFSYRSVLTERYE